MALTIYPTENWDSYVSEVDADALISANLIETSSWGALTSQHKEIYLKTATRAIKLKITDPEASETPDDLALATVLLANYSIGRDMTNSDGKENLKRIKIDGAIEKEFFSSGGAKKSNAFPDDVIALLGQFDYQSANSFTLDRS
jgi:hypothetical protein